MDDADQVHPGTGRQPISSALLWSQLFMDLISTRRRQQTWSERVHQLSKK